jgi:hypothetical protein
MAARMEMGSLVVIWVGETCDDDMVGYSYLVHEFAGFRDGVLLDDMFHLDVKVLQGSFGRLAVDRALLVADLESVEVLRIAISRCTNAVWRALNCSRALFCVSL